MDSLFVYFKEELAKNKNKKGNNNRVVSKLSQNLNSGELLEHIYFTNKHIVGTKMHPKTQVQLIYG